MVRNPVNKPPFEQHLKTYRKASKKGRGKILNDSERVYQKSRKRLFTVNFLRTPLF